MLSVLVVVVVAQSSLSQKNLAALETRARAASRMPGTDAECQPRPQKCSYEVSDCMSPFARILSAVETRKQSTPQFLKWAEEIVREGTDAYALPAARRMLARAKHPNTEAMALPLLREGDYACVAEATRLLAQVPALSDEARDAIRAAMHSSNTLSVGDLIAARDEPWAQALALEALRSADERLHMGIIHGLRKTASKELRDAVNFAASCEPSNAIRSRARERLVAIGAKVTPVQCPAPEWKVTGNEVTNGVTRVRLSTASNVAACDGGLGLYDGRCIGALDFGEWGGALGFVQPDGGLELFAKEDFLHPRALLKRGPDTLVLSTLGHMSGSGAFGVLRAAEDGGVRYEATLLFTDEPVQWAATDEQLFVAFPAYQFSAPCRVDPTQNFVMVYTRDGGASLAESPASACVWKR